MFSSASSAELVRAIACDPLDKQNSGHLFVCQPHTIQIIQLVEGPPPPPPRPMSSVIDSSAASSSASSASSSSSSGPSCPSSSVDASSYCSSIVTPDESCVPVPWTDDTFNTRMKRVHAWIDNATCQCAPSLKRKSNPHPTDDDTLSHCSKRSRSRDGHTISRLTGYPCPACDTLFPSLASLRKHGHAPDTPEACRVAVDYNFE